MKEITSNKRVIIYGETNVSGEELTEIKSKAKELGHDLQLRAEAFIIERIKHEFTVAFISHDSNNKDIAKKIAVGLSRKICPVWYDEFRLKVGDNLRVSIEKGLKECKKCVLILSPEFISNGGWTQTEFDSIFTREIIEQKKLVLPVWLNVDQKMVYNYSPSLANVLAVDWSKHTEDEVINKLYSAIMN